MVTTCVFVVLVSLILQPIHRAYAEELVTPSTLPEPAPEAEVDTQPAADTAVGDSVPEPVTENDEEVETVPAQPEPADETEPDPNQDEVAEEQTVDDAAGSTTSESAQTRTEETASTTGTVSVEDEVSNQNPSTSTVATSSTETQPATTTTATEQPATATASTTTRSSENDSATSSPSTSSDQNVTDEQPDSDSDDTIANADATTTVATATTPVPDDTVARVVHTTEQNAHQFGVDDCVMAGNGAYYCTRSDSAEQFAETGVFAAPDSDGDTEIFVRVAGETVQLTDNQYDDGSPYYDNVSERVVWHSLRGDRYQIVAYDFTTEQETVLTNTSYNNMEPVAFGEMVAWQAWRGGDWEIMLFDGEMTIQLTSNDVNDVAPSMYGGFIMWQAQFAEGARLAIYDVNTGSLEHIKNVTETSAAANPRLMLLYDQVDSDGTKATYGFDVRTGETMPLGQSNTPLPERLPSPEQSGNEKALVHAKPTARDSDERDKKVVGGADDDTSEEPEDVSVVVLDEHDLVLPTAAPSSTVSSRVAASSSTDVIANLVIEGVATTSVNSTGQSVEHIPDLIVPPTSTPEESGSSTSNNL